MSFSAARIMTTSADCVVYGFSDINVIPFGASIKGLTDNDMKIK